MSSEPFSQRSRDVAFQLFGSGQPLGASVFFVQSLRQGEEATTWAELGCALQDCAGLMVRSAFFESAQRAFCRAEHLGLEGPMVGVVAERRALHADELDQHALGVSRTNAGADRFLELSTPEAVPSEALDFLEAFLMVSEDVVVEALSALSSADRIAALAIAAESGWAHLDHAVEAASEGRWGPEEIAAVADLQRASEVSTLPEPPDPGATVLRAVPRAPRGAGAGAAGSPSPVAIAVGVGIVIAAGVAIYLGS